MVSRGSSDGSRSGQHTAKPPHLSHLLVHALTEVGHAATVFGSGLHASMDAMRNSSSAQIPRRQPPLARARLASIDARTMLPRPHHPNPVATIAAGGGAAGGGVTREELGRATWTLLHATAAQFPERPTRRQQRDARQMINALSRTYPCAECSKHFREIIRHDPPVVSSAHDFQMWMCRFHNTVNKSIGKPAFNCAVVASRWGKMDCDEEDACTIKGR